MAPTLALVVALLASQVAVVSAEGPKHAVFAEQRLACDTGAPGGSAACGCSSVGMTNNASVTNCSETGAADVGRCNNCCASAVQNCLQAHIAAAFTCGTGKQNDYAKFSAAAGSTAAAMITNCCMTAPTATCGQITCSTRRRINAATSKAKAGQAATVCTSSEDCDTKCCEDNTQMCGAVSAMCGSNHTQKAMTSGRDADCAMVPTAAASVTFTGSANSSNADYKSKCCDAKATCAAVPTCPTNYVARTTMPDKCAGATCAWSECCQMVTTTTMCSAHCTAGTTTTVWGAAVACEYPMTSICNSTKCDAGQSIDNSKMIANGATAADAAIKTACCITTPMAPAPAPPPMKATCAAFFAAVVKAKGTAGGAYLAGVSMPIMLAVAALLSAKL